MSWVEVWDDATPWLLAGSGAADHVAVTGRATLWLELVARRPTRKPLRLWAGRGDARVAAALYLMPDGAYRFVHDAVDRATAPGFAKPRQRIMLRYAMCQGGRRDALILRNLDTGRVGAWRPGAAERVVLDELLPRENGFAVAMDVCAIADHADGLRPLPGIGAGAMVLGRDGRQAIETIEVGDDVALGDGRWATVRLNETTQHLCLGSAAPVTLRAPYFGLSADICVPRDTRVLRTGPEVEYLSGTHAVFVRANDLVLGRMAYFNRQAPVRTMHHLLFHEAACVRIDRCAVDAGRVHDLVVTPDEEEWSLGPALQGQHKERPVCHDPLGTDVPVPVLDRHAARALSSAMAQRQRAAY